MAKPKRLKAIGKEIVVDSKGIGKQVAIVLNTNCSEKTATELAKYAVEGWNKAHG